MICCPFCRKIVTKKETTDETKLIDVCVICAEEHVELETFVCGHHTCVVCYTRLQDKHSVHSIDAVIAAMVNDIDEDETFNFVSSVVRRISSSRGGGGGALTVHNVMHQVLICIVLYSAHFCKIFCIFYKLYQKIIIIN